MKSWVYISIWLTCIATAINGQMPTTNLLLFELRANEEVVLLNNPRFLTAFNQEGYNNQPFFIDDNSLLFTSNYKDVQHTDIYEIQLANSTLRRLTATSESEYSPIMNNRDNLTVISQSVSEDGDPSQYLWSFDPERKINEGPIINSIKNVGYYCWLNDHQVALYLVSDPNELILYDLESGQQKHISYRVGRSLKKDADGNLIYLHKVGDSLSYRKYNLSTAQSSYIISAIGLQEDFEILPNGDLICSQEASLYRLKRGGKWTLLKDLSTMGVRKITRIAVNNNKIALVVE